MMHMHSVTIRFFLINEILLNPAGSVSNNINVLAAILGSLLGLLLLMAVAILGTCICTRLRMCTSRRRRENTCTGKCNGRCLICQYTAGEQLSINYIIIMIITNNLS